MTKKQIHTNALIQSALTSTRDIYREYLILAEFFRRCQDFPGGEKVADAMMKGLKRRKMRFTAKNLIGQWKQLKRQPGFRKLAEIKMALAKVKNKRELYCPNLRRLREARWKRILDRFDRMTVKQQERFLRSKEYKKLLNEM